MSLGVQRRNPHALCFLFGQSLLRFRFCRDPLALGLCGLPLLLGGFLGDAFAFSRLISQPFALCFFGEPFPLGCLFGDALAFSRFFRDPLALGLFRQPFLFGGFLGDAEAFGFLPLAFEFGEALLLRLFGNALRLGFFCEPLPFGGLFREPLTFRLLLLPFDLRQPLLFSLLKLLTLPCFEKSLLFSLQIGEALALCLCGALLFEDRGLLLRRKLLLQFALAPVLFGDPALGLLLLFLLERGKLVLKRALPFLLCDKALLALADISGLDRLGARFGGLAAALYPPRRLLRSLGENDARPIRRGGVCELLPGRCENRPDEKSAISADQFHSCFGASMFGRGLRDEGLRRAHGFPFTARVAEGKTG